MGSRGHYPMNPSLVITTVVVFWLGEFLLIYIIMYMCVCNLHLLDAMVDRGFGSIPKLCSTLICYGDFRRGVGL